MSGWKTLNDAAYGAFYRARERRERGRGEREARALLRTAAPAAPTAGPAVLWVAWGRIGDAILATGAVRRLRRSLPGRRLVVLARAETAPVLAPLADLFVPMDPAAERAVDPAGAAALRGPFEAVLGDLHLFYGGTARLGPLLEGIPAPRKYLYEGYHLGRDLAVTRPVPRGFTVVPALAKRNGPDADLSSLHLVNDAAHYLREVLRDLSVPGEIAPADLRPDPPLPAEDPGPVLARLGLEPGAFVAWQPFSSNRKKDYPAARWREVLARFPGERFVALGSPRERERVEALGLPGVADLCGRTGLGEAVAVLRGARAYLGLDSGLTHMAACLGRPAVCVAQDANLGYFFPYPEWLGFPGLRTVHNPRYRVCAGCFMTCSRESVLSTWLRGGKCLREIPPGAVADALASALPQR